MADSKITALTAISTVDPTADPLVIVDVSDTSMAASGTTKKSTINQLLGSGGTATLASATITGDLTVDTSTLKVDSTNNRVGVGTATPDSLLQIAGAGTINWKLSNTSDSVTVGAYAGTTTGTTGTVSNHPFFLFTNNTERYRLASDGVATWSNVGGVAGTAMTLNSTGLGVGISSPFADAGYKSIDLRGTTGGEVVLGSTSSREGTITADGTNGMILNTVNSTPLRFYTQGGEKMRLDVAGNVGIGVTPSAKLHVEGGGAQARFSIASASDARHEYYRNGIREGLIYWDANLVGLYATQAAGEVVIASSNTIRARVKASGQVRFVPLASDPAGAEAGDVYYNSTSNKLKCYNGTTWNDLF